MIRTRVGYAGGTTPDPTYRAMGDHTESLQVDFDPRALSYEALLERVWSSHDPTRKSYSRQYMAAVFCHDDAQLEMARRTGERAARARGGELRTRVDPLGTFTRAEDYHQKYRLRREHRVTDELVERFGSDRAMVDSTAAARLNGLLRGFGDPADLEPWLARLELSPAARETLVARVHG